MEAISSFDAQTLPYAFNNIQVTMISSTNKRGARNQQQQQNRYIQTEYFE